MLGVVGVELGEVGELELGQAAVVASLEEVEGLEQVVEVVAELAVAVAVGVGVEVGYQR
jgi:hypothetical protein